MEVNLFQDQNGYFPADLMVCIANYACVRTVTAMLLSSKYWNKIIDPLLQHPPVTVLTRSESLLTRTLYHFKRGRGYMLWSKDKEDGAYPRERRQDSDAFVGYFNSLIEMRKFLDDLKVVITDPNPQETEDYHYNNDYCVIMGSNMDNLQYFDLHIPLEADPAEILRAKNRSQNIRNLLLDAGYINTDANHHGKDHIFISIQHKVKDYYQVLDMTVLADGDVIATIHGKVFRSYRVRTSKKLFEDLLEIIKYSKHKRKMEVKHDTVDQKTIYSFDLIYELPSGDDKEDDVHQNDNYDEDEDNKPANAYYIQHKVRRNLETNRSAIETNGYKTGALEKVVKLLEDTLFNQKGPSILKEKRVILPPQSKGNALFDSVRLDPKLRSVGIPNVVAIVMKIEDYKQHHIDKYIISIYSQRSLEDLKATLNFLSCIEDALLDSEKEKKISNIKHVLNSRFRIIGEMKIYTHSPASIVEITKTVLDLVANYSLKYFPSLSDTENNQ